VGTITGVADKFTFSDSSMNFDVNAQLSPGLKAKIGFQTGKLAGLEFILDSYNNTTKTFKIALNKDDKAYPDGLPNDTLKPEVGDKYAIFDIQLPQSYIDDAEQRLLAAGQAYYDKYKHDQFEFTVSLTPIWVKQQAPVIDLGYTLQIVSTELDIDK